jgi:eukaryotic-like serine/threonine-protein kinase
MIERMWIPEHLRHLSLQGMCAPIRKTDSALNPIDLVQIGTVGVYLPKGPSRRKRLWTNDTVVEFEHSINAAMKRLRQALGDSAEVPRFIETLARRGYRWKTPVQWMEAPDVRESHTPAPGQDLIGKKVSHYRVLEILGGGGMGVVYKAEDIKLGRPVALKFLPEELANDAAAMQRFEREARAASALNHPNICTIHAIEEYEAKSFIVMELLEGCTLRDVIAERDVRASAGENPALPIETLLNTAIQLADGLDAAHKKGVIHRDVKPANIFITNRGQVKILDFGLAKLRESQGSDPDKRDSSANAAKQPPGLDLTRTGLTIGTAGYMSPEQVRGEILDARSDLFCFGLVLYEMAAGHRAFTGETAAELRAAVLDQVPPPLRESNPQVPTKLERIIDRALQKGREARYQTAPEIRADLHALQRDLVPGRMTRWRLIGSVAAALALIAIGVVWFTEKHASQRVIGKWRQRQLTVNSSENPVTGAAISPDGKYLAYTDLAGINLKLVASGEIQRLPLPDIYKHRSSNWQIGAWLPDSTHFFAIAELPNELSALWVVSVSMGPQRKIATGATPWGVSPDGTLLALTTNDDHEIWLVGPTGENPRKLINSGQHSRLRAVQWSPNGQRLAYVRNTVASGVNESQIETVDVKSGLSYVLLSGEAIRDVSNLDESFQDMSWLSDGRLLYVGGEADIHGLSCNLWAVQVENDTGRIAWPPERITNWAGFCVSNLSQTSDGTKLVFARSSDLLNVYVAEFDSAKIKMAAPRRLTFTEDLSSPAAWSADNKAVYIRSNREGAWGIYHQPLDGRLARAVISGLKDLSYSAPVSPDGKWIIYMQRVEAKPSFHRLMRVPVEGGASEDILDGNIFGIRCAQLPGAPCVIAELAPDGKQLIFTAVDALSGRGPELARFSYEHADQVEWDLSPDGKHIVLFTGFTSRFTVLSLGNRQSARTIDINGDVHLRTMAWSSNGRGFFASDANQMGAQLIYIDLQGSSRVLWELKGSNVFLLAKPSPDGHYVAIQTSAMNSNMWMLENF